MSARAPAAGSLHLVCQCCNRSMPLADAATSTRARQVTESPGIMSPATPPTTRMNSTSGLDVTWGRQDEPNQQLEQGSTSALTANKNFQPHHTMPLPSESSEQARPLRVSWSDRAWTPRILARPAVCGARPSNFRFEPPYVRLLQIMWYISPPHVGRFPCGSMSVKIPNQTHENIHEKPRNHRLLRGVHPD